MENKIYCYLCGLEIINEHIDCVHETPMHLECYQKYLEENLTLPELLEDEEDY